MLNISDELKELYREDNVHKELLLYFPELELTITNEKIVDRSFTLTESICSGADLKFGSCNAAIIEVIVADTIYELSDKIMIVTQIVDGTHEMPLGTYIVDSADKQSDRRFKKIVGYDYMLKANVDVSGWYNALTWPQTVKSMRESLLTHLGLSFENQTLTNDTVILEKTVNPSVLMGSDILKRLCEINAGFGHFARSNTFKVIQLSGMGLYPSETLYPSEDLFPSEPGELITAESYRKIDYSEYIIEPITQVKITEDDEDVGAVSGDGNNVYTIMGNYLLFGKTSSELQAIADEIFLQVKNKYYRKHTTVMSGRPYMEVGDSVLTITTDDAIESFIFKRVLTGVNTLKDTISATGNQFRDQKVSRQTEIQQLKSKTLKIQKNVDGLQIELTDTAEGLQNQITLTAGELQSKITDSYNELNSTFTQTTAQINQSVTDVKNNLQGQIDVQASNLLLKVDSNGVIAAINLSPETAKITAPNIQLEGIVTANNNFKILLDGSIEALNANFSNGNITGSTFTQVNGSSTEMAKIRDGLFTGTSFRAYSFSDVSAGVTGSKVGMLQPGYLMVGNGGAFSSISEDSAYLPKISCSTINGYAPITSGNNNDFLYNSNRIYPNQTSGGNVGLYGLNVASVNWCNDTFEPKSSSDFRLKHDFKPLCKIPIELYLSLKLWQYRFKTNEYGEGIFFGLLAQQVETAFKRFGLNAYDYNLIEIVDSRKHANEGQYVLDGKVHRINYENFHAWTMLAVQKLYQEHKSINNRLSRLESIIKT